MFGNYFLFKRSSNNCRRQNVKGKSSFNKSSISQLTTYVMIFIISISLSGCFLKEGHEAAADAMVIMLLPSETEEKTEAHRLLDVYEVRGLLINDPILHETMWGAAYVPHLVLDVEEIVKVETGAEIGVSPISGKKEYLKLTCRHVSDGIHGIYEMDESIQAAIDQKVRIQGTIYQCKDNWYICEKDETEVYCDMNGKAYHSGHVELINLKMDEIGKHK